MLLAGCGFTPMYSDVDSNRLNIQVVETKGDYIINSKIISKLKIHNNSDKKLFKIKINTNYIKVDFSKNLKGEITEYQLNAKTNYTIIGENLEKQFNITESFIMKNFADDFEERDYEKRLKNNIADTNYQKLMLQLLKLK
tara:strand:- start:1495 stop:1914 length:420 start_codon:yes stop_codon:yes gene_type:complete